MKTENDSVGKICPPCESAPKNGETAPEENKNVPESAQAEQKDPRGTPVSKEPLYEEKKPPRPKPSARDTVFALCFFVLGWLHWELPYISEIIWCKAAPALPSQPVGMSIFTVLFSAVVLSWLYAEKRRPPKESWFWFAVMMVLGLSLSLPYGGDFLGAVQIAALYITAAYWTLSASGRLAAQGNTSEYLPLDLYRALAGLPWGNFGRAPAVLYAGFREWRQKRAEKRGVTEKRKGRMLPVLAGVCAAAVLLLMIVPLLTSADAGFELLWNRSIKSFGTWLLGLVQFRFLDSTEMTYVFLGIPTAMFMYGLVYGCVHARRMDSSVQEIHTAVQTLRIAPRVTLAVALGAVCAVYAVFIAVQANYLFRAFCGNLPQGFSYAEYARRGFFELCRAACINLVILIGANATSRTPHAQNKALRAVNGVLSGLTLLLIATAGAKMGLYIARYGLTRKRVLVSVFLIWLAAVFICIIIMQVRKVAAVRIAALLGAVLFTLLCALPVPDAITGYNRLFERTHSQSISVNVQPDSDT